MASITRCAGIKIVAGLCLVTLGAGLAQSKPAVRKTIKTAKFDRAAYNSAAAYTTARLKYYPPRSWLRHYLGDDRYKIAGTLWTVATTDTDTYYHRFTCPNMLRQSPNGVIGFASPSLAADAGYQPDPLCRPGAMSFIYIGAPRTIRVTDGPVTTVNRGRSARRIILADRVSTVLLPPNWRRTQSGARTIAGQTSLADTLEPLNGNGYIRISVVRPPANLAIDMSKVFNAQAFPKLIASFGGAGVANNISVTNSRLGGISGINIVPKAGASVPYLTTRTMAAGRGKKIYVLEDKSENIAGASTIINSFSAR